MRITKGERTGAWKTQSFSTPTRYFANHHGPLTHAVGRCGSVVYWKKEGRCAAHKEGNTPDNQREGKKVVISVFVLYKCSYRYPSERSMGTKKENSNDEHGPRRLGSVRPPTPEAKYKSARSDRKPTANRQRQCPLIRPFPQQSESDQYVGQRHKTVLHSAPSRTFLGEVKPELCSHERCRERDSGEDANAQQQGFVHSIESYDGQPTECQ